MIISRSIHIAANSIFSFFFMAEWYSIVYMYHIFFIHSSVDGHLDYFRVLASLTSAVMNLGCMYLFESGFCLDVRPGAGPLDQVVGLFSVF